MQMYYIASCIILLSFIFTPTLTILGTCMLLDVTTASKFSSLSYQTNILTSDSKYYCIYVKNYVSYLLWYIINIYSTKQVNTIKYNNTADSTVCFGHYGHLYISMFYDFLLFSEENYM